MDKENDVLEVTEFIEGQPIFESKGISLVKITKVIQDDDGKPINQISTLRIPIKSSGVDELVKEFGKESPKPPVVNKVIKPGTDLAKQLGMTEKGWVQGFDLTDPEYIKTLDEHNRLLGMKVVLKGLAVIIKDKEGNIVEDDNEKVRILRGMGLTGEQFTQIANDISMLTKWEEVREDAFLSR